MNEDSMCRPRRARRAALAFLFFLIGCLGGYRTAAGQYMYLDANGDSLNTQDDFWYLIGKSGEPATLDLYLVTDRNRDGQAVTCETGSPGLDSYFVHLFSNQATVTFSNVENRVSGMTESVLLTTYPNALSVGYSRSSTLPPGRYHLLRMTVVLNGCPDLQIRTSSCFAPAGMVTSFGGGCLTNQGNDLFQLGQDWTDTGDIGACTDFPGWPPTVSCPGVAAVQEGETLTFPVSVYDPECATWSFWGEHLPEGSALSGLTPFVAGQATSSFTWTPRPSQAGVYPIQFWAEDPPYGIPLGFKYWSTCSTVVTVTAPSSGSPPIARAGGPYSGIQDVAIAFDGSASSDPEGGALDYVWDLGDGGVGAGPTPVHAYASGGTFQVGLTVLDPSRLWGRDSTTATITAVRRARVFTTAANQVTRLPAGKPFTCFQVEPESQSPFVLENLIPSTLRLRYSDPVCGDHDIAVRDSKTFKVGDTDRNGVGELEACFTEEALATLSACLTPGAQTLPLVLWGSLMNGDLVRGAIDHTFILGPKSLAAVSPNPLSASSALEFTTSRPGFASVFVFDVHGKTVDTFLDERSLDPGYHRIPLLSGRGGRLASGVYFLRVATEHDGTETRAVTIVR